MPRRRILFVRWDPASNDYAVRWMETDRESNLRAAAETCFRIDAQEKGIGVPNIADYHAFDWEPKEIPANTTVSCVRKPGIVILIGDSAERPRDEADRVRAYLQAIPESAADIENWLASPQAREPSCREIWLKRLEVGAAIVGVIGAIIGILAYVL